MATSRLGRGAQKSTALPDGITLTSDTQTLFLSLQTQEKTNPYCLGHLSGILRRPGMFPLWWAPGLHLEGWCEMGQGLLFSWSGLMFL